MTEPRRRRAFLEALITGAAGLTITWPASGQGRGPAPIAASKLTDRIAVLSGAGGNVGVLAGADGLVMTDGGLANRAMDVVAAAAQISPRMVQVLFNTHYHFDHVGSNELLGMRGVRIIGHENVKKRLMTTFENPAMGRRMDALAPAGLPTETFARVGRLMFGAETLEYTHTPLAHTDGDAFVFFPAGGPLPRRAGNRHGRVHPDPGLLVRHRGADADPAAPTSTSEPSLPWLMPTSRRPNGTGGVRT